MKAEVKITLSVRKLKGEFQFTVADYLENSPNEEKNTIHQKF